MIFKKSFAKRGTGWIKNKPDTRDFDFDKLGLSSEIKDTVDLRYLVPEVLDQSSTSSCVANATAHAVHILETKNGLTYTPVSRMFLYYNSRKRSSFLVQDDGTYIRDCLYCMSKAGVPNESIWPFRRWKVNKQPNWQSYMKAYGRKDVEYYTTLSSGEQLILELKAALSDDMPVIFGTGIGNNFYNYKSGEILDIPREKLGGHAMVIVGYFHHPLHGLLFIILNSWGKDFGDSGFCLMSEDYIRWIRTRDFTFIRNWNWLKNANL